MWNSYLKIALRFLNRNRRFSIINLTGLTIGLACFIIIVSWIANELSFDRFHRNRVRIYQLTIRHSDGTLDPNCPYALAPKMFEQYPEIESYSTVISLVNKMNCSFSFHYDSPARVNVYESNVARVDTTFFEIFDFSMLNGDKNTLLSKPDFVVISSKIADKYFYDSNPVGQTILFNNFQPLTVSGVVEVPENTYFHYDFFLPVYEDFSNNWNWADPSFLLIKPRIDIDNFKKKIESFMNDNLPGETSLPRSFVVSIIPIHKVHLAFGGKRNVYLFGTVAFLLLLVASLNYMNITSANYAERIREIGMRKVLGAKKSQLMLVFFAESFILVFLATVLAMIFAGLVLPALTPIFGRQFEIGIFHQPGLLVGLIVIIGLISSLASLYPSFLFTGTNPVDLTHRTIIRGGIRSIIILVSTIFQFTLAIALLISTLIVIRQVRFSSQSDLGFSINNVISVRMNSGIGNNFNAFLERLESHPEIEIATAGQAYPFDEDYKTGGLGWALKESQTKDLWRYTLCRDNYLDAFKFRIVNGRGYSDEFGADRGKYVINETAAKMLGFKDPVGQQITMWGRTGEIIGIVKDFHHVSLHKEILPHIFNIDLSYYQNLKHIFIRLVSGQNKDVLAYIESVYNEFAPDFPFSYSYLEDEFEQLYATDVNLSRILGLFALLTIIISGLSIYGLAFYSVEQKTKEIAIRKVFGANLVNNLTLISKNLFTRIGVSFILAIGLSLFVMGKWLQTFAYRINLDIFQFILPAFLAFMVAGIAILFAMWRPVKQNPADLLKQE
jgi:putative ABC transport system permease protein